MGARPAESAGAPGGAREHELAMDDEKAPVREAIRASGRFMGLGLTWALGVLLFFGVGAWLDSKLGTEPVLMVVGAFVGAGAGFYSLYYHIVIEPRNREHGPRSGAGG